MKQVPDLSGVTVVEVWAYAKAEAIAREEAGALDSAILWLHFAEELVQVTQSIRAQKEARHEEPNV